MNKKYATTRLIRKVINVLTESTEPINIKDIAVKVGYKGHNRLVTDAILFLMSIGMIDKTSIKNGVKRYYIIKKKRLTPQ